MGVLLTAAAIGALLIPEQAAYLAAIAGFIGNLGRRRARRSRPIWSLAVSIRAS